MKPHGLVDISVKLSSIDNDFELNINRYYCCQTPLWIPLVNVQELLIEEYFNAGFTRTEILAALAVKHGLTLSLRTLARILKKLGLGRRYRYNEVREAIRYELAGSGSYLGCRSLARRLLSKYSIRSSRGSVLAVQKELDPDGVALRKSQCISRRVYKNPGPNHAIHIDGYDKLKPFAFPIHGAIDGYSRRVIWLKLGRTNNNPAIEASYFLEFLEEIEGSFCQPACDTVVNGFMVTFRYLTANSITVLSTI